MDNHILQSVFNAMPYVAILILEEKDRTIIDCNKAMTEISGFKKEELVGESVEKVHIDDKSFRAFKRKVDRELKKGGIFKGKFRLRKKDGSIIETDHTITPVYDQEENIKAVISVLRDTTEKKHLERVLRETQQLAGVGGWEYDLKKDQFFWTEEVYRIHEVAEGKEVNMEQALNYFGPEGRPIIKELFLLAIETGEGFDVELPLLTNRDHEKWVRIIGRTQRSETGKMYKLYGVFQDLTDRKQMEDELRGQNEKLRKMNATRDKIYYVIGHDLKTPLSAITGFSEIMLSNLSDTEDNEEIKQNLQYINFSAHKISQLLENLLNWARLRMDNIELVKKEFSVHEVVENTVNLLTPAAQIKDVELEYYCDRHFKAEADERMIATIIRNLVSNAIKFCEENDKVTVSIDIDTDEKYWIVKVEDTGVGMSEEVKKHLFEENMRNRKKGTHQEKGTGLGLILCKDLAELHEGTIKVESEKGKGSVFEITIPFGR